jgi:hypothetical protein
VREKKSISELYRHQIRKDMNHKFQKIAGNSQIVCSFLGFDRGRKLRA